MSDLHSINEAINKRAGRKLLPSIAVGLFLLAIIFSTMAYIPFLFAVLLAPLYLSPFMNSHLPLKPEIFTPIIFN